MSSLELTLFILVIVAVGGVLALNAYQSGQRRRLRDGIRARQQGASRRDSDSEPSLQAAPFDVESASATDVVASDTGDATDSSRLAQASTDRLLGASEDGTTSGPSDLPSEHEAVVREAAVGVAAGSEGSTADPMTVEPELVAEGPVGIEPATSVRTRKSHEAAPIVDGIECVVALWFDRPIPGERLISLCRDFRRAGAKPVLVEGLADAGLGATFDAVMQSVGQGASGRAYSPPQVDMQGSADSATPSLPTMDDDSDPWLALDGQVRYLALRAGVLLANRHGPLNAMEFSEFTARLQALSETLDGKLVLPDMLETLASARQLDARCASLDSHIGVNVEAQQALTTADLSGLAADTNLHERGNNRYARIAADGELRFSVALGDAPNRLSFLLDVPRVTAAGSPLREMVSCAWDCAQRLEGRLVDDAGRALNDEIFDGIESQLASRYAALEEAGFPAGSPVALRLFN